MKELYKGIANILQGDATLKTMVGYAPPNRINIRRGYQSLMSPEGNWNRLVIFYLQPAVVKTDFTSHIRDVPLIVRVYDRDDDLNVEDIAERVIVLLDGGDLSVSGQIHVYNCSYQGDLSATSWNQELKSYEKILSFMVSMHLLTGKS